MTDLSFEKLVNLSSIQKEFNEYQSTYFPKRSSRFFALELCGEAGELANLEKKDWRRDDNPEAPKMLEEDYAKEASDVFIALMNYCNEKEIDLADAVKEKLKIIEQRRIERKI